MFRVLFVLGLLAASAVLLYLWQTPRAGNPDVASGEAENSQQGYTALNAHLIDTGPDGRALYQLTADRIDQSAPPQGDVLLTQPRLEYEPATGSPWTLRADRGVMPADASSAQLNGSVQAQGTPAGSDSPMHIQTEQLHLDMTHEIVTTPVEVRVDWAGSRLLSHGLWADLKHDQMKLESNVHGQLLH
jgi:LPS export ABC transporter protein LptC